MYQRLTVPTEDGYRADGLMAVERLGRLEDVIDRLLGEYTQTKEALARLRSQGKEHTAAFHALEDNMRHLQETLLRLGCL